MKEYFQNNKNSENSVILNFDNEFKNHNDQIDLKLFFNANDRKVYKMLNKLRDVIVNSDKIRFNPVYSFDLPYENTDLVRVLEAKGSCMCGSRYCDDFEIFEGGEGRKNLIESVRQKCVYVIAFDETRNRTLYFDYMSKFHDQCYEDDMSKSCSDSILNQLKPGLADEVFGCYINSFKSTKNIPVIDEMVEKCDTNAYLEEHNYYLNNQIKKALPLISIDEQFFYVRLPFNIRELGHPQV